jgi:adenylosuccinate lyase
MIPRYSRPEMSAIWTEQAKYERWLEVEIAVCEARAKTGEIPKEAVDRIKEGAAFDINDIAKYQAITHHDMTAFLQSLAENIGDDARYVHYGLTTSDVWDTATGLQLRDACAILLADLENLNSSLENLARSHKDTLCVGRTHGVHAEPTTFGLKIAVWVDEMRRNKTRLEQANKIIATGAISGTVGTHASISPDIEDMVCKELGLSVEPVSTQIVQRDRHAEFLTTVAIIGGSLEKFATEIRGLQKTEVREVEEPFAEGQTGSSSMPHKRNPEKCERITGIARILRGYAGTGLENIALWHERDISHSSTERVILPDSCLLLDYALDMFTDIVTRLQVYPERMKQNMEATHGLVFSQRILLELIEAGLSRENAYGIVQRNAMVCWETGQPFLKLLSEDKNVIELLSEEHLRSLFDYNYFLSNFSVTFERLNL